jgi:hypothetical protein
LSIRPGRDRPEIVNCEEIAGINRFIHRHIRRVIPSEIRTRSRYGR